MDNLSFVKHRSKAKRKHAGRKIAASGKPANRAPNLERENAALRNELEHALEREAATSDVLKVISRSTFDLQPVLETLVKAAARLCNTEMAIVFLRDGAVYRVGAAVGFSADFLEFVGSHPLHIDRGTMTGRVALEKRIIQVEDVAADPEYRLPEVITLAGQRTALGVPLFREAEVTGVIVLARQRVEPFTQRQIELVTTFADQAVIAIENTRLVTEQRESLEQQTATAEVLQVINSSPGDLTPVFNAILEKARNLCGVAYGALHLYNGGKFHAVAVHGHALAFADRLRQGYTPGPKHPSQQLLEGARFAQARDWAEIDDPIAQAVFDAGFRTTLFIPLRKDGTLLGQIAASRVEIKPFVDKEIALLESFAAQAVIAMENARLITETREALERQTATAEVLEVINTSSGELEPVFDAILDKALRLSHSAFGTMRLFDGTRFELAAQKNVPQAYLDFTAIRITNLVGVDALGPAVARVLTEKRVVQIVDAKEDELYKKGDPMRRAIVDLAGARTILFVPLLNDDVARGIIMVFRTEVRAFSDKEVALLQNFAAQAVIAMENARLLGELRQRTADLGRSVDELTATGDVLKIISRSSVALETVLDTLVETVARLCRAEHALMFRRREELFHLFASRGISPEAKDFFLAHPFAPGRDTVTGRAALERRAVHITDALQDPEYTYRAQTFTRARTLLGIPLLREETLVGIFVIARTRVDPFTNKEIELATTFADQAVIAIENARLFDELRERQAELRVTFDNMGDGVVMFDAEARLTAWNRNFQEMLELPDAFLAKRPSHADYFHYLAGRGEYTSADLEEQLSRTVEDTKREMRYERTRPDGRVIEVRRNPVPGGGFVLIYADITERKRAEAAISAARDAAETALRELQTAQASLVHAQKMAALGQLTAGIAHEIKNPLNFVNNFAGLSVELLDELKQATVQAIGALDADKRAEIVDTIEMLTGNLEKIAEHGRRADGIVRSMLQHSRGGSGDWQASDLNTLVEEALNLAYHGARAQDQSFNITMERDLDQNLALIDVVPQDMMRVFLNLIGNGFYAANKRSRAGDGAFRPVLKVTTRELGDAVEIGLRDNGIGISPEHREKLFQPFFTTKPTGEGTGLGLSISFEIVSQQHGGTITVDSEVGEFTEFTVRLPRRRHPAPGRAA
jgi:PAS domain S-box-containing protein